MAYKMNMISLSSGQVIDRDSFDSLDEAIEAASFDMIAGLGPVECSVYDAGGNKVFSRKPMDNF